MQIGGEVMESYDNAYSRFVGIAKVALPLIALGILSTLFLLARTFDPERAIPYAEVYVDQLVREQRLTGPTFSTVTRDGAAISLSAEAVRPDIGETTTATAEGIKARIDLPAGSSAALNAPRAQLDEAAELLEFAGGVYLDSSLGYEIGAERLYAALDRTDVWSVGPVQGRGPGGTLEAGGMRLTTTESGDYVLVFNEGVRLVYDPATASETP